MSAVNNFNALIVGLQAWTTGDLDSSLFAWGCHRLAFLMPQIYPKTQAALFKLLEQPVADWYPDKLPKKFDRSCGLLEAGELSREANEYYLSLAPDDLPKEAVAQRLVLENVLFHKLYVALKKAYASASAQDKPKLQAEYVALRQFVIEHPYSTTKEIKQHFRRYKYASASKVGDLYRQLSPLETNETAWVCDRCGPLSMKYGHLKGVKPDVCDSHSQEADWVNQVTLEPSSRQLLKGLQLNVLIPGVIELELFQTLKEVCQPSQDRLVDVVLYPEIDSYDLQLRFSDRTVWAVDVKDVPNPLNLADELGRIYGSGSLKYDKGFYVVPEAYVDRNSEYLTLARTLNDMRDMQLMGTDTFENNVMAKIKQLQRGQKK